MSRRPSDQTVRDRIVTGIQGSLLVEASAGTGKTRLMVERILRLIAGGAASIEGIVAITFTEKAAGELRLRLRTTLGSELRRDDLDPDTLGRYRQALFGLDRATVTTIHSFCAQILRERPIEAGVMPGFAVADEIESARLRDEAWDLWIESRLGDPESDLRPLFAAGLSTKDLRDLADALVSHHDLLADPERAVPDADGGAAGERRLFGLWHESLGELVNELPGLLAKCRTPATDDAWSVMTREADRLTALCGATLPDSADARRKLLRAAPLPKLGRSGTTKNWADGGLARLRGLERAERDARAAWGQAWAAGLARQAVMAAAGFLQQGAELKAARGVLDFQDLLVKARDLVRRRPDVRAELQATWTHLLVDEFQDTDPLQAEIVFYLSDPSGATDGWDSARPAPGRLFLVGDPKQSIYRFRRADIDTYNRARAALEAAQGETLRITENFRTRSPITDWVNRAFERLMAPGHDLSFRPAYSPLSPFRRDPAAGAGPALLRLELDRGGDGRSPGAGARRRIEARGVAALLLDAVAGQRWRVYDQAAGDAAGRPARFGDVAILFRTFTPLDIYEEVFRAAGVPYRVEGGKYYFQRTEVQSLLATLRAVDNLLDREALVAALRSPLYAFSDDDLLIAADEGSLDLSSLVRPSPPGMADTLEQLRGWHARRHRIGPARLLEEILAGTKALEFFSLKPLGEQRVANLMKVVDEAERFQGDAGGFRAFIRHLSEREAALEAEAESPLQEEESGGDAVQILSIHKSKGLEFPVVILGDLNATPRVGRDSVIVDRPNQRIGAKLPRNLFGMPAATPGWRDLMSLEEAQTEAEEIRLLYVATTRARDLLILPHMQVDKPTGFQRLLSGTDLQSMPAVAPPGIPIPEEAPIFRNRLTPPPFDPGQAGPNEIEEARRQFTRRRQTLLDKWPKAPVFIRPSGLETPEPSVRPEAEGQGKRIGRAVHQVLEQIAPGGGDIDRRVEAACAVNDLAGVPDRKRVRALVETALRHDLWKRAMAAPRMAREAPFLMPLPGGDFVDGVIDLLFEEGGALVIVEYKTDAVGPAGVAPLVEKYREQGLGYLDAVGRWGLGRTVEMQFLFLDRGVGVPIRAGGPA